MPRKHKHRKLWGACTWAKFERAMNKCLTDDAEVSHDGGHIVVRTPAGHQSIPAGNRSTGNGLRCAVIKGLIAIGAICVVAVVV